MTFAELNREVMQRSFACGGTRHGRRNPLAGRMREGSHILAAATIVAAENGVGWCKADLERFIEETLSRLGFWVSIALFFFGGTGLFWLLAKLIIPALIDWLIEQEGAGVCGLAGGDSMLVAIANEAVEFLNREQNDVG